jgi:CxxC motif-containing protein
MDGIWRQAVNEKTVLTCVICPKGCRIEVSVEAHSHQIASIEHAQCRRGIVWAREEITHPKRTLCSSVLVVGGDQPLAGVRTSAPIPLEITGRLMELIITLTVEAPVHPGMVICSRPLGLECDIIATRGVCTKSGLSRMMDKD